MTTLTTLENIYGTYKQVKFWIIVIAIAAGSGVTFPLLWIDITSATTPGQTLLSALLIIIATFGLCLLPFASWQHISRKRFFAWLNNQRSNLEKGATHPDGYTITYDTQLLRYQCVFSAIFATVSFASRPYVLQQRSAGAAQASFTIFSLLFGWWFLGPEGAAETIKAIVGNMRSSQNFTLRQLLSKQGNA